ncbi:MAG: AbrB/MazE/SpoVT family DNA-binding domain-containing protein [Patescibacteria group bacterium]
MTYTATLTVKGQITLPKKLRDLLNLDEHSKLMVTFDEKAKQINLSPMPDILSMAGSVKPKGKNDILESRIEFEKNYERV